MNLSSHHGNKRLNTVSHSHLFAGVDALTFSHLCEATLILTLLGQEKRQQEVKSELLGAGIELFEFYYGLTPADSEVQDVFNAGVVARYPPCFRCGNEDCGDLSCNNILLPVQVAVVLSFRALFAHCLERGFKVMAIGEDDIVFAPYARSVFSSHEYTTVLAASGLFSESPTLVRLGDSRRPQEFDLDHWHGEISTHGMVTMSNYLFLCNRSFAVLANQRLANIDHTADVLIHQSLCSHAHCLTLSPQIVCDRSWALRTSPSLIHPKPEYLEHLRLTAGEQSAEFAAEQERLRRHRKRASSFHHVFVGLVNCDFARVVAACRAIDLDVGCGVPAADGFAAWQYTTNTAIELIPCQALRDLSFVHVHSRYLVLAEPASAILDLAFRLEAGDQEAKEVARLAGSNSRTPPLIESDLAIERAVALYIGWHRLARDQSLKGIVGLDKIDLSLKAVIAGSPRPSLNIDAVDISDLTSKIDPKLALELHQELTILGFYAS